MTTDPSRLNPPEFPGTFEPADAADPSELS